MAVAAGWSGYANLSEPWHIAALSGGVIIALFILFIVTNKSSPRSTIVVKLRGITWTTEDFCRGWLITGDTGSGKTRSGITPLLYQVFTNSPGWGGICIDDKGLYWETLKEMTRHFHRESDLILLQVRPDSPTAEWTPSHTFNLTSDRGIPFGTYAKFVVDTASSLGQQGDKGFFRNQAHTHIAAALEVLYEIGADVTLENVYHFLLNQSDMEEALDDLSDAEPTERRRLLSEHFRHRFLSQPPEQIGGVKETIANYLQYFLTPEIAQVFCPTENTFEFSDIDRGKIICIAMPQKFQTERRYVNTFLKMLFYTHVLRRFDKPKEERKDDNLLILWADEAQRFMTASEDGMSDYNCVDVIREARATVVAAAQSSSSFIPPLGREKARVLTLNLRNRMIFRAADEEGANESADFLGKKKVIKKSWGYSGGRQNSSFSELEEHKIKPHILRSLPKHTAVLVHCERGFKRTLLPPIEPDGTVSRWFSRGIF
ncbi:type IV secretory system conjugative DNA transfer family protein [Phragmitibacter flavus]|uniref:type IV secretory system conjugative DNA transfer family protein n=1 Tax=Phragmitibacter flavus TaxID=2576071 RepID=UPI001408115F|nr:type IV secretion system DNA-binding domain-containing protein [Phragmitibacter flavus]